MSDEQYHGVICEPDHTCPLIDAAGDAIIRVEKSMRNYDRMEKDELLNVLSDIDSHLFWGTDMDERLEKIRTHVIKIREWGQGWKEVALKYHDEMQHMESPE